MKPGRFFLIAVILFLAAAPQACAEEVERDMFGAVSVNPLFRFTLDNASISFGFAKPGDTIELKPDAYYNMVKCTSNKGRKWYLKLSIMGEISGPVPPIALGSFKWKVFRTSGDGTAVTDYQPFTAEPVTAYTSGSRDVTGDEVTVQFKYKLDMPTSAIAGIYSLRVLYTMTDTP